MSSLIWLLVFVVIAYFGYQILKLKDWQDDDEV
jgi:membrane protein DedA with SNARE-associated domain